MPACLWILADSNDPDAPKPGSEGYAAAEFVERVWEDTLAPGLRPLYRYIESAYNEDDPIEWASPAEGLRIVEAPERLAAKYSEFLGRDEKLDADLAYYRRVLDHAKTIGAKWMFCMDD